MADRWVLIREVNEYRPELLRKVVEEGFERLGRRPEGKVLIKPNVVFANKRYSRHAYTHPELVGVTVDVARELGASEIAVGESGGYAVPGRMLFEASGYYEMGRDHDVPVIDFNEEPSVPIELKRALYHKRVSCPKRMHEADFKIWMPKLKYHICCQITNMLKLNIGSLLHKDRMLAHDDRLNDKIIDVLEMGFPDLIISDAITIGHGFESCAKPFHLGVVLVSNDPVAMDVVAAQLLNYAPQDVVHLRRASERGYGEIDPSSVEVISDISIGDLAARTLGIESEFQDIQKVETPIRFYEGINPASGNVCYGGCMVAVKGCLGTIDARTPGALKASKEGAIVTGVIDGDVDAGHGVALLIGDCTQVRGKIRARKVKRVKGCPVGAVQLTTAIPLNFGMPSPMLDVKDSLSFVTNSASKGVRKLFKRAF